MTNSTIAAAAEVSGVDSADLERFIQLYTETSPAVIRCGWGIERNRNGGSAVAAVLAMPAIANKFGVRGGGYTLSNADAKWTLTAETAIAEPVASTRVVNMSELGRALRTLRDPAVEMLVVYNCNPVATAPDQRAVIEQLSRDDLFVVVHEQVMTDTAQLADVILPATTFLEQHELHRGYGAVAVQRIRPVAAPRGEARRRQQGVHLHRELEPFLRREKALQIEHAQSVERQAPPGAQLVEVEARQVRREIETAVGREPGEHAIDKADVRRAAAGAEQAHFSSPPRGPPRR